MIYVHHSINVKCWLMFSNSLLHLCEKVKHLSKERKKEHLRSWNGNTFIFLGNINTRIEEVFIARAYIASKKFVIPLKSACDKYTRAPWVYFALLLCVHLCFQYKCVYMKVRGWCRVLQWSWNSLTRLVIRSRGLPIQSLLFSVLGL